jgi:hypothetical protein
LTGEKAHAKNGKLDFLMQTRDVSKKIMFEGGK